MLFFIKILIRGIKIRLEIVFVDESGFHSKNNNFYTWRSSKDDIYHQLDNNKKFNLLLGVTKNRIIKYKIIEETTNSSNFLLFMSEMVNSMSQEERINSIFVMDNCSSHLTAQLFQFYYVIEYYILNKYLNINN